MSSFENLIIEQRSTIEHLTRILPNYRKLGKDKFSAVKTRNRITALKEKWTLCESLHIQLQQTASEVQRKHDYFLKEEFLSAEEDFQKAMDSLTELLAKQEQPLRTVATSKAGDSAFFGEAHGPSAFVLPRITIPTFQGDPTKWESFRDSFAALVGSNDALTAAQKLYFLKSFLGGDAALLVEHIQISDTNYAGAWRLLTDEYDNLRALVFAHIHAFASLPVMKLETAVSLKHLRDVVCASLSALINLKRPAEHWDDLLLYIITQKFSSRTRTEWNLRLGASNDVPSFHALKEFLTERIHGLAESVHPEETGVSGRAAPSLVKGKSKAVANNATGRQCPCCQGNHFLAFCPGFRKKLLDQRYQLATQSRLCFNCLKPGHFPPQCPSEKRCTRCQKAHHSFLHRDYPENKKPTNPSAPANTNSSSNNLSTNGLASQPASTSPAPNIAASSGNGTRPLSAAMHSLSNAPASVLLATAWVHLRTAEGRLVKARALLDQGASFSFITESLAQRLRTSRRRANLHITVFGEEYSGRARSKISLSLEPCYGQGPNLNMIAYVYNKLPSYVANHTHYEGTWPHLNGLTLADPDPTSAESIDVLIGADLYGSLLLGPIQKGPLGSPTAQLTTLGWIVSGPMGDRRVVSELLNSVMHCVNEPNTDALIRSFWEIEEIPEQSYLTPDEQRCENHFVETHARAANGRYVVRLPFRSDPPLEIGESYAIALLRYTKNERRFLSKPALAAEYNKFLSEYKSMGHMERVCDSDSQLNPVYIPHHPVLRESSTTTRLRVVFNASSATSNGTTLNDFLLVGPKLQRDIISIILGWRQHRYVYIADIEKMFRQILVHPSDADYQRIVWRPNRSDSPLKYRLLTVTYGTACAPYLALRVLFQLAQDEGRNFPEAADILRRACYVDDVLFGADDVATARQIRDQLNALMKRGGFHLRKWAANDVALLHDIPAGDHELAVDHSLDDQTVLKVLGLIWLPNEDAFGFQVSEENTTMHTKRSILSFIARLFDPLGWASPIVISAKLFMQDLWLQNLDWDEPVPPGLLHTWTNYCKKLPKLTTVRMPRWTGVTRHDSALELYGFSDASQRAYSAVVYLRVLHSQSKVTVALLTAKSKVAPLKTVSIPRLELNGMVLLVRLLDYVKQTLEYDTISIHGWTDSTVALAWISQHPSRWPTYVANRVSAIQTMMPNVKWHHVPSQSNPADCASRGIPVDEFLHHPLWWSGPPWLLKSSVYWPNARPEYEVNCAFFSRGRQQRA